MSSNFIARAVLEQDDTHESKLEKDSRPVADGSQYSARTASFS